MTRPNEASRLGITVVPQDILMVPEFSIGRNILLGWEGGLAQTRSSEREERRTVASRVGQGRRKFRPGHQNLDAQRSSSYGWRR